MKKIVFIGLIIMIIIPFIPIRTKMKDGSTIYKSMLYKITKVHRHNDKTLTFDDGLIIEILGEEVHNSVPNTVEVKVLEKKDIVGENGLLFSIRYLSEDIIPVKLEIYDSNKYILYTSYKACTDEENCNLPLEYTESNIGIFDYDALKIIENSYDSNEKYKDHGDYEIYTGKDGHRYITYDSNNHLQYFLKLTGVDLKQEAVPDYE